MNTFKSIGLSLGLAALLAAPLAAADSYSFDGAHSSIGFSVKHLGIFNAQGTFDKFDGGLKYDAKDVTKSSVEVTIDAASVNTRNEMRDKHLKNEDFFHVEKFPSATFKSTKVAKAGDGLKVTGKLTLRGVTKEVVLDARITGSAEDDWGNQRIGFEGSTTINRKDFGIAWDKTHKSGAVTLADLVTITLNGEAIKAKADAKK